MAFFRNLSLYSTIFLTLIALSSCTTFNISDLTPPTNINDTPLNNPRVRYTLSSTATSNTALIVNDRISLTLNEQQPLGYYDGQGRDKLLAPFSFEAPIGSTLKIELLNEGFGSSCEISDIYVRKQDGSSQKILDGVAYPLCPNGIAFSSAVTTLQ